MRVVPLLLVGFLLGVASPALASLCKDGDSPTARHLDEAATLQSEAFTAGSYAGSQAYDARVLECNRQRDSLANDVEKAITARHVFAQTLAPLLVKGHIQYFGWAPVRYGYELRRDAGTWKVTVPAEFHLPSRDSSALDVPFLLATASIADGGMGITCDTAAHPKVITNPGHADNVQACRVGRGERFGGQAPDVLLFKYWQREIQAQWSRPGFTVVVRIVNLGEVDAITLKGYEKENIVWHVRFNDKPESRATYKAVAFKPHPLFAGLDKWTFFHEFGHVMGMDDEYPEKKNFNAFQDCPQLGGDPYIMCDDEEFPLATNAKGLYAWIATRRYSVADQSRFQCKTDNDCQQDQYCDTGSFDVGANTCATKRASCASCDADKQCSTPLTCVGKPLGRCSQTERRAVGAACCRDDQCSTGSCSADGHCQCKDDSQCPQGERCDKGMFGVGKNKCVAQKVECASCSANDQCSSPLTCVGKPAGRCARTESRAVGAACCRDDQCDSKSCASDGRCQCKSSANCGVGQFCAIGPLSLGRNECVAFHAECASCSSDTQCRSPATCKGLPGRCVAAGTVSVGASCCQDTQCRSGSCSTFSRTCQCTSDRDCPSTQHCATGTLGFGRNQCVADTKGLCASCSSDGACTPPFACLGKPLGHCGTAHSMAMGQVCCANDQCVSGLTCQGGRCVCTDDKQCPTGQKCKKPLVGSNHCE